MIQFYLDGNLYDNPHNWENLTDRLFYSEDIAGYVNELSGSVDFFGGAYTYLRGFYKWNM